MSAILSAPAPTPLETSASSAPGIFKRLVAKLKPGHSRPRRQRDDLGVPETISEEPIRYQLYESSWDDWVEEISEGDTALISEDEEEGERGLDKATSSLRAQLYSSTGCKCDKCQRDACRCDCCTVEASAGESEEQRASIESSSSSDTTPSPSTMTSKTLHARQKHVKLVPTRTFLCEVCLERKPQSAFPLGRLAPGCSHPARCCVGCFSHSITSQLSDKFSKQLSCPICPAPLDYETIAKFATTETFVKYDAITTRECMKSLDNWWECPQPDCSYGGVHEEGAKQPIIYCSGCGRLACYVCGIPWHGGLTCKQYQEAEMDKRRRKERVALNERFNAASAKKIDETTKACPSCKVRIEKFAGCQHMSCSKCQFQFCWDCQASWKKICKEGNTAHSRSCPWHTDNLR